MSIVRLNLEGTFNTRDLGGYETEKGYTSWKKLLRSDCCSSLTNEDISRLKNEYNLSKVIDLRSFHEINTLKNKLSEVEGIEYYHISLMDDVDPTQNIDMSILNNKFLTNSYLEMLDTKQEELFLILSLILDTDENESILFNCTAGQDRTGVVSMMLLGLLGVSRQDIASNYMQSTNNLKYNHIMQERLKLLFGDIEPDDSKEPVIWSHPNNIETAYDHIIENYGSFIGYFEHIGCDLKSINTLKAKFLN